MSSIKVALDTSFLIFILKRKMTLSALYDKYDSPIEFYTSQGVLNELYTLSKSGRSIAQYAALAIKMLKTMNIRVDKSTEKPDEWLLKQPAIATVDMRLAKMAHKNGIRIISLTRSNKISIR